MVENSPQDVQSVGRLRRWATTGEGAPLFAWGSSGSYTRCIAFYTDKVPGGMLHGWCASLYHEATGRWPGAHNDHHFGNDGGPGK